MARRGPKRTWQVVLLLIAAVILWLIDQRRDGAYEGPRSSPSVASGTYEMLTGCRLEAHRQNDGDSFRIRLADGRVEEFRLYYVDAPESAFRSYAGGRDNHRRISEQARDFGISDEQAVEIGRRAKQRVHDLLARGTLTVHTAWDDPFNDRRYHAFIQPSTGPLLHETLVREGLVRIHTKPADLPDGTPVKRRLADLQQLEAASRQAGQGAWAFSGS